ncbi:hydroxyethylthiazole kinase [Fructobacillus sp. M1-13]|uniref:Hydroxyethylthiazole kinase n=1 Tax=Fructobacillus papyriferae TaxID=2713171 RepID=A0ABS5QQI9_9LACO|nr:hydroxyethylthiazole kinase [Fructobacillus papyriferae]MBS9334666.1 hydroxyethylthiazole kinase [Fructobacillus papyriferae]MCD2158656.1 hydroxyethylthiazole kinase [Fructobacillus papyriferae]
MSFIERMHRQKAMVIMNGNHVTEQLVADVIAYLGGSPLVAEDERDDEALVSLASAIVLNMGTVSKQSHQRLIHLGRAANLNQKPVVFDPVGAGASTLRKKQAEAIMAAVSVKVIRGNLSEIAALLSGESSRFGIDATSHADAVQTALDYARLKKAWVVISGPVDTVSDGKRVFQIKNGHPYLEKNVGMGDALDSILALGLVHTTRFEEFVQVVAMLPVAADLVIKQSAVRGPASFKMALLDKLSQLSQAELFDVAHIKEVPVN